MTTNADFEQNRRVQERFTRTADAFVRVAVPQRASDAERIARMAQAQLADTGLDLACGPGTFALALAPRMRRVLGVDLTLAFLRKAQERAKEQRVTNVQFLRGDATALPVRDESIDVASCGYSFHHMREPLRALREMARVLSRGGRLAVVDIYTPDGSDPGAIDRIERARDSSHLHVMTREEFRETVERAGFCIHVMEYLERPRQFSDWMQVAGWKPHDPAWRETRRLMESHLVEDATGFRPRLIPPNDQAEPEIEFMQQALFLGATKS